MGKREEGPTVWEKSQSPNKQTQCGFGSAASKRYLAMSFGQINIAVRAGLDSTT